MSELTLKERTIPCNDTYDIVVAGGGPAGCTAAAAAARDGARTLLIETTGALGGMGTSALVPAWCPFSDREKIIYCGLAERVLNACKAGMPHVAAGRLDWVPIDAERLKRVYDDLVIGSGAHVLFNTMLTGVELAEPGVVDAIVCANKSGLTAYRARVFIDCTGDADLAFWAGAGYEKGKVNPDGSSSLMPATHCFLLTNVDDEAFQRGPVLYPGNAASPIYAIVDSGLYPSIPDVHICVAKAGPGAVGFNAGHLWDVDNTDAESVSKALVAGRKLAADYRDALAAFYPEAFGNAFLAQTGSLMGIRETRRITGDYTLTLADYMDRRSFDDEICRNSYFLDVHADVQKAVRDLDAMRGLEQSIVQYAPGESHGIPYRCLTPAGIRNVLVAGRSISCERVVQGSVRVMPVCLAMGEAAGAAAAQVVGSGSNDVHAADVPQLRERLRSAGAYLP